MKQPAITVYMPVYNREKYVKEAVSSILTQTFSDFELVIVDDGSTDNSVAIIEQLKDERIVFLRNEKNSGVRITANKALKAAKGRYIIRMDSDDISLPHRLQRQFEFMEAHPEIGICGSQLQLFGNETDVWRFPLLNDIIKAGLCFEPTISQPSSIIRSELLDQGFFFSEEGLSFAEDYELWYRMKDLTRFANMDEILVLYRREDQNITVQLKEKSQKLLSVIHKRILSDMGIDADDEELRLHHVLQCRFPEGFSPADLAKARAWTTKLLEANALTGVFPKQAFRELLDEKWERMFYFMPSFGYSFVREFANHHPVGIKKAIYYLKHLLKN